MFIFGIISLGDSIQGFFQRGLQGHFAHTENIIAPTVFDIRLRFAPAVNLFNLFFPHGDTKLEKFLDPDSWIPGI